MGYFDSEGALVHEKTQDFTWALEEVNEKGEVHSCYTNIEYRITKEALYRESLYHNAITQEEYDEGLAK